MRRTEYRTPSALRDGLEASLAAEAAGRHVDPNRLRRHVAFERLLLRLAADTSVIALWLGHESVQTTQIYLHADLALKERALARTTPPLTKPGRYRPPDPLLAFLTSL